MLWLWNSYKYFSVLPWEVLLSCLQNIHGVLARTQEPFPRLLLAQELVSQVQEKQYMERRRIVPQVLQEQIFPFDVSLFLEILFKALKDVFNHILGPAFSYVLADVFHRAFHYLANPLSCYPVLFPNALQRKRLFVLQPKAPHHDVFGSWI